MPKRNHEFSIAASELARRRWSRLSSEQRREATRAATEARSAKQKAIKEKESGEGGGSD